MPEYFHLRIDHPIMLNVLTLAKELISIASLTPKDLGCQTILMHHLTAMGFTCQSMPNNKISNFWAKRGDAKPLFVFAGHTDVVPSGPLDAWKSDPFVPEVRDGILYGRGAADMKGALAAMLVATERFIHDHPHHNGSIGFLITSAEEGPSDEGTPFVLKELAQMDEHIDWCVVGEASSSHALGDVIKNGRRGSLTGTLKIIGKQGHVAYPELACNPIHQALPALTEITNTSWDTGNEYFPPSSLQISNLNSGTGASNVIPGDMTVLINIRFCPESTPESISQRVEAILKKHNINYHVDWHVYGTPYLTTEEQLLTACQQAVQQVTGLHPQLATDGGTSDGRYIAAHGTPVIEVGPSNRTIHQIDECILVAELDTLCDIYYQILVNLFMK
jgi:succinyl-diaminopimelate desuccinylase